ncbi:hypothetical protein BTVI_119246 [Pitangus sulphuratus]|nr:hypothetical protein BTVI_119246 [Pitangus sulphuratus]
MSAEPIEHDFLETIKAVYSSRPDLKEEPFEDADNWFSDGSSFVKQGVRMAGYAVTTTEQIVNSDAVDQIGNQYVYDYVITVGKHFDKNATVVIDQQPKQPDCKLHPFNPGDWVYVKNLLGKSLQEKWEGSFQVLLTTFTAVRVKE